MKAFHLPCHYDYSCGKMGNISFSKTYHTVSSLLKLFQLIIAPFPSWLWFTDKWDLFLLPSHRLCPDHIFHTIVHNFLSVPQIGHSEIHRDTLSSLSLSSLSTTRLSLIYLSMTAKIKSLGTSVVKLLNELNLRFSIATASMPKEQSHWKFPSLAVFPPLLTLDPYSGGSGSDSTSLFSVFPYPLLYTDDLVIPVFETIASCCFFFEECLKTSHRTYSFYYRQTKLEFTSK